MVLSVINLTRIVSKWKRSYFQMETGMGIWGQTTIQDGINRFNNILKIKRNN